MFTQEACYGGLWEWAPFMTQGLVLEGAFAYALVLLTLCSRLGAFRDNHMDDSNWSRGAEIEHLVHT